MKKYNLIGFFLFFIFSIYGQIPNLQNSNWIFGVNTGIQINTNNTTPSQITLPVSIPFYPGEGSASVSAKNGNLLFFTDGQSLWQKWNNSYTLITNQLKGNTSSSQNAIIIPRPNHRDNYYIVSIDGTSGYNKGLYYSEINLSNGIGQMVSLNIPLKDQNLNLINESYLNRSEAITSTLDYNNIDYWVVTHVVNNSNSTFLSYHITENGFETTPSTFLITPNLDINKWVLSLKISQSTTSNINFAFSTYESDLFVGNFNHFSGNLTLNSLPVGANIPWDGYLHGIEFSNNKLFYSNQNLTTNPHAKISYITIDPLNINSITTLATIFSNTGSFTYQLQLNDLNKNQIFCANYGTTNLSTINYDGINSPSILLNNIPLSNLCRAGLPQIVPYHLTKNCVPVLNITSPNYDVYSFQTDNNQSSVLINSSNYIASDSESNNSSGGAIVLSNGFYAANGSKYKAFISPCSTPIIAGKIKNTTVDNFRLVKSIKEFLIIPNPASNFISLKTISNNFNKIIITSIDGKTIYNTSIDNSTEYNIDISLFPNGLYIISILFENGETVSKKLIKN